MRNPSQNFKIWKFTHSNFQLKFQISKMQISRTLLFLLCLATISIFSSLAALTSAIYTYESNQNNEHAYGYPGSVIDGTIEHLWCTLFVLYWY